MSSDKKLPPEVDVLFDEIYHLREQIVELEDRRDDVMETAIRKGNYEDYAAMRFDFRRWSDSRLRT